jgi:hypothetical protein
MENFTNTGQPSGNFNSMMMGNGIGNLLGAGLLGFGMNQYSNPADAGMDYLNQIKGMIQPLYQPYMDAGTNALPTLQSQYGNLMNNPGALMNQFGAGFQQSPGFKFQTDQALGAANRAASAGGMLGSPQEQQQIAGTVNGMANQDYYNYLNHVMSMYGQGLNGEQGLAQMGANATNNYADNLQSALMSQAQLAYAGQADQNMSQMGSLGGIGGFLSQGLSSLGLGGFL